MGVPGILPCGGHTSRKLKLSACPLGELLCPTRHYKEGLKRGAAQRTDIIKVLGREKPALVVKGKEAS